MQQPFHHGTVNSATRKSELDELVERDNYLDVDYLQKIRKSEEGEHTSQS